ncbi:MAG: HPr family phosphocarrier protein [Simkaniaceae bacterium]|nr:HPr family phosphocarrier protein [Simkaniaceae bacterium]
MESKKVRRSFIILNERGFHSRPASKLRECLVSFKSKVFLYYRDAKVDGKCFLSLMQLQAPLGAEIEIRAEGVDAEEAVEATIELVKKKFKTDY